MTVELPVGTVEITSAATPIFMLPHVHLMGSGDSLNPAVGTIIEGDSSFSLPELIQMSNGYYTGFYFYASASEISNMYLLANTTMSTGGVVYSDYGGGSVDQFTVDSVTIDSRNTAGTTAAWDVDFGQTSSQTQFLNSTFIGQGLQTPGGLDMIVDNCHFYGCGEGYGSAAQILCGEGGYHVSVTRTTDQSLVNNITSPGGNVAFDGASRLLVVQGGYGYVYAGDNTTQDLYEYPDIDENGGEQILYEPNTSLDFQGSVNSGSGSVTITGFGSDSINVSGGASSLIGETVLITSGPGMGESRRIIDSSGTLNMPWGVVPTSASNCTIGVGCNSITAYDNTLAGDGALSYLANSSGIQIGGLNISIVGNDISKVPVGLYLFSVYAEGSFNNYVDNSIHQVGDGILTGGSFDGSPTISSEVGDVFSDNTIGGPAGPANGSSVEMPAGILMGGGTTNIAETLMTIFNQNIITDFPIGIGFLCQNSATGCFGGILDTVLSNDFFSSDGSNNSVGLTRYWMGIYDYDSDPYQLYGNTQWQNSSGPISQPHRNRLCLINGAFGDSYEHPVARTGNQGPQFRYARIV